MTTPPVAVQAAERLSRRARLLVFLYGNKNIAGSVLALGGVGLYYAGLIESFWPLIVAGLYGIGFLAAPRSRALESSLGQSLDAEAIQEALDRLTRDVKKSLEPDLVTLVGGIVDSIREIVPRMEGSAALGDRTLFDVRQTALDYLPATLARYATLPSAFRRLHTLSGGQNAHDLLKAQLTLLDTKMKEAVISVHEGDTEALLANGRFLQERFRPEGFRIEGPKT